jgi:hypothetical protein
MVMDTMVDSDIQGILVIMVDTMAMGMDMLLLLLISAIHIHQLDKCTIQPYTVKDIMTYMIIIIMIIYIKEKD